MTPEHGLSTEQVETLRDLVACWGKQGFVLIGARALSCFVPLTWRQTEDLDVTVLTSMDDFPAGLDGLPEWRQDSVITQRWYSRFRVRVDVLPVGEDGQAEDVIRWPGEDREFNRVGLRLATDFAVELPLVEDLTVRVAPVVVICVLKMISYQDRPGVRQRDLSDLANVLRVYPTEPESRFQLQGVWDHGLDYDQAGPFVLGHEIDALGLKPDELALVDQFLDHVEGDVTVSNRMARELSNRASSEDILRLVEALRLGLGQHIGE